MCFIEYWSWIFKPTRINPLLHFVFLRRGAVNTLRYHSAPYEPLSDSEKRSGLAPTPRVYCRDNPECNEGLLFFFYIFVVF